MLSRSTICMWRQDTLFQCLPGILSFVGYVLSFLYYLYLGVIVSRSFWFEWTCPTVSDAASTGWFTCRGQLRT